MQTSGVFPQLSDGRKKTIVAPVKMVKASAPKPPQPKPVMKAPWKRGKC